jgi:hypothetical protein
MQRRSSVRVYDPPVPTLKLVPPAEPSPAEKVRQRVRRMDKPSAMLQCNRCGGREMIETKTGMLFKDGKASGGTKQVVCVGCLMKGERVVVA